jgi:hypothetical protein
MKSYRLNAKERTYMQAMGESALELRFDYLRRFRNAVYAISQMDQRWMIWVEQNLPENGMIRMRELLLVEARARTLVLKAHGFFGRKYIGDLIFRQHWAFTDSGSLSPG